jgi:hypothetical protein
MRMLLFKPFVEKPEEESSEEIVDAEEPAHAFDYFKRSIPRPNIHKSFSMEGLEDRPSRRDDMIR